MADRVWRPSHRHQLKRRRIPLHPRRFCCKVQYQRQHATIRSHEVNALSVPRPHYSGTLQQNQLSNLSITAYPLTLRARSIALHRPTPGLPIAIYGLLSDYGRSYVRPFSILIVMAAVGALPFWMHFGHCHVNFE
jgi:hypothetical protein